jgi:hypothetical protein
MQQLLLTKEQRILLRCHQAWTVDHSDDSQQEPDGKGFDILVSQVAGKNLAVALFTLGKLKKLMQPLTKRKLSSIDVKLIKKSFLDYIEPVAADRSPRKDQSPVTRSNSHLQSKSSLKQSRSPFDVNKTTDQFLIEMLPVARKSEEDFNYVDSSPTPRVRKSSTLNKRI